MVSNKQELNLDSLDLDALDDTDYREMMSDLDRRLESNAFVLEDVEGFINDKAEKNIPIDSRELYDKIFTETSSLGSGRSIIKNKAFLADVLEGLPPDEKAMVLQLVVNADIKGDDPLFFFLLATGKIELLLHKKPLELSVIFDRFFLDFKRDWDKRLKYNEAYVAQQMKDMKRSVQVTKETMKAASDAALDLHTDSMTAAVNTLVSKAAFEKVSHDAVALTKAAFYIFISMIIGGVLATMVPRIFGSSKTAQDINLDNSDIAALEWAKSDLGKEARNNSGLVEWVLTEEGQFAKEFFVWNHALLSKQGKTRICQKDAERLGVALTIEGRPVVDSYCTLWIKPPKDRKAK